MINIPCAVTENYMFWFELTASVIVCVCRRWKRQQLAIISGVFSCCVTCKSSKPGNQYSTQLNEALRTPIARNVIAELALSSLFPAFARLFTTTLWSLLFFHLLRFWRSGKFKQCSDSLIKSCIINLSMNSSGMESRYLSTLKIKWVVFGSTELPYCCYILFCE